MSAQLVFIAALLAGSSVLAQPAPPSTGPSSESAQATDSRDDRDQRRQERWERYRNATPGERSQMRVDRIVDRTARTYELDDMQKVMVRQEMLRIQAERRAEMGADAEEIDKLRDQMLEYWGRQRPEDGADRDGDRDNERGRRREMRDNPEFRSLRERMRELEDRHPFDWDAAAQRIESLLPPEQAERGRLRREENENRRRDRRGRDREGDFGERRRGDRRDAAGQSEGAPAGQPTVASSNAPASPTPLPGANKERPVTPLEALSQLRPQHPWETYTRQFIAQHELSEAQANSAHAVLRDLQTRALKFESTIADRVAEVEKIRDPVSRNKRLAELRAPIEQLFSELKVRLDGLLTAAQRQRAGL